MLLEQRDLVADGDVALRLHFDVLVVLHDPAGERLPGLHAFHHDDADAVALVYHARYAPTLARIRDRLPRLRLLLQVADGSEEPLLPGAVGYEAALAEGSSAGPPVRCTDDDLYVLYTGGTTGAPKGARKDWPKGAGPSST